jgi:hypothetical protein
LPELPGAGSLGLLLLLPLLQQLLPPLQLLLLLPLRQLPRLVRQARLQQQLLQPGQLG